MQLPNSAEVKEFIIVAVSVAGLIATALAIFLHDWKGPIKEISKLFTKPLPADHGDQCAVVFIPYDSPNKRRQAIQFQAIMKLADLLRESLERSHVGTQKGFHHSASGVTLLLCGTSYDAVRQVICPVIDAYALAHSSNISVFPFPGAANQNLPAA